MTINYQVKLLSFSNLLEIEGVRTNCDFAALLDAMEYGDLSEIAEEDLRQMCVMSLQDLKPAEAAYQVLKHDMGNALRDGQMRNLASEMLDEKMWEEYADSSYHERMFNVGSLLYEAFPQSFPKPDAVRVELQITAETEAAWKHLIPTPHESLLVRLLSDGMDDHAVLHRLYSDQLTGKSFPAAEEVVWIIRSEIVGEKTMRIEVISSGYWLDALSRTKSYESNAYADEVKPNHR